MLISEVELRLVLDNSHNDSLGVIQSTYYLGRMYDHNSNKFSITSDEIDLSQYDVQLRFISGNHDLGRVLIYPIITDDGNKWIYEIPILYTMKDKLQIQVILSTDTSEVRSNIVTFKLGNSLPQDQEFYQNLSYLNRLVCDNKVNLKIDNDTRELILLNDINKELCRIDIDSMLIKEWW